MPTETLVSSLSITNICMVLYISIVNKTMLVIAYCRSKFDTNLPNRLAIAISMLVNDFDSHNASMRRDWDTRLN